MYIHYVIAICVIKGRPLQTSPKINSSIEYLLAVIVTMGTGESMMKSKKVITLLSLPCFFTLYSFFPHLNQGCLLNRVPLRVFVRELRSLVIEMVLSTDMSSHLLQVKAMKSCLQQQER